MARLCYPSSKLGKQDHFPKLHKIIEDKYGEDDPFVIFLGSTLPFLDQINSFRNCCDHRLKDVKFYDFEVQRDGSILKPTIEIDFRKTKLDRGDINELLSLTFVSLMTIFENTMVYLAEKGLKADAIATDVRVIAPEERHKNKLIQFGWWSSKLGIHL